MNRLHFLSALSLSVLLVGCQPQAAAPPHNSSTTVTIDTVDGPVTVAAPPQKVAVFSYAALDTLDALGVHAVAAPEKRFLPYLEQAAANAEPAGTIFEPDAEALHRIAPDLIILGLNNAQHAQQLQNIAPVIKMDVDGRHQISEGLQRLESYGRLFHKTERAAALKQQTEALLAETRDAAARTPGHALVVIVHGNKLLAYGENAYFGWIYRELGIPIVPAATELGEQALPISFEYLHQSNPDWLFVLDRGSTVGEAGQSATTVLDNPLVARTHAAQRGQIVYLSGAAFLAGGGIRQIHTDLNILKAAFEQAAAGNETSASSP